MPEWALPYFLGGIVGGVLGSVVGSILTHNAWMDTMKVVEDIRRGR